MVNEPTNNPNKATGADKPPSEDEIFARMERMLSQEQQAPKTPATAPAAPRPAGTSAPGPLELTQIRKMGNPPAAKPAAPAEAPAPTPTMLPGGPRAGGITPGQAAARLDNSMKAAASSSATVSNRSLDAIVEEVARGMIQEWMDKNMERIVREEAAKAATKVAE